MSAAASISGAARVPAPDMEADQAVLDRLDELAAAPATHRTLTEIVALVTKVRRAEIFGSERNRRVAKARHILFFLCERDGVLSLPQIGERTGSRDHATVMHGCGRVRVVVDRLGLTLSGETVRDARRLWAADWPRVSISEAGLRRKRSVRI